MAETKACILLSNEFIRTVVELTLENVKDPEFCRKSSHLLSALSISLEDPITFSNFFFQIKRFGMIKALLKEYHSDDSIYISVLTILKTVFVKDGRIQFTIEELESFLINRRTIDFFLKDLQISKSNDIVSLCDDLLKLIYISKPKFQTLKKLFHLILIDLKKLGRVDLSSYLLEALGCKKK